MSVIGSLARYFRSTRAVSALEYAAIVGIIVVALTGALVTFRESITNYMNAVVTNGIEKIETPTT